jgi:hypothetical protein
LHSNDQSPLSNDRDPMQVIAPNLCQYLTSLEVILSG